MRKVVSLFSMIHKQKRIVELQSGQTLITLLVFMMIGITIITSGAMVLATGLLSTSSSEQTQSAYFLAESGAEDGVLRLLRDPLYSGTYHPIPTADGDVTVTIASGSITSIGKSGNTVRKIKVDTTRSGGKLQVTSWREI